MLIANILLAVALSLLLILLAISVVALIVAYANQLLLSLFSGAARSKIFIPGHAPGKSFSGPAVLLREPKPSEKSVL
jgi:hypothetical protein